MPLNVLPSSEPANTELGWGKHLVPWNFTGKGLRDPEAEAGREAFFELVELQWNAWEWAENKKLMWIQWTIVFTWRRFLYLEYGFFLSYELTFGLEWRGLQRSLFSSFLFLVLISRFLLWTAAADLLLSCNSFMQQFCCRSLSQWVAAAPWAASCWWRSCVRPALPEGLSSRAGLISWNKLDVYSQTPFSYFCITCALLIFKSLSDV